MMHVLDRVMMHNATGNIYILTHGDMDGLVSALNIKELVKRKYQRHNYIIAADLKVSPEHSFVMLNRCAKMMHQDLNTLSNNDMVFILDRPSFQPSDLENVPNTVHYTVLDHHATSETNHKIAKDYFVNSQVIVDCAPNISACMLSYYLLCDTIRDSNVQYGFYDISNITCHWDTFLWKTLDDDDTMVNDALSIQACDKIYKELVTWNYLNKSLTSARSATGLQFASTIWDTFKIFAYTAKTIFFTQFESMYKLATYKIYDSMIRFIDETGRLYRCVILHEMREFQSLIADRIFEDFESIEIVIFYNDAGTISIRTRDTSGIKANYLASEIGKLCGYSGGGHPNAAGGRIEDSELLKNNLKSKVVKSLKTLFKDVIESIN